MRGVFSGALPGEARFTLAFHRDLADLGDRATGMLVRGPGDAGDLARRLAADRDVERVLTKAQASAAILAVSAQMTEIIHLAQAVSVVIAALSVFASVGYTVLMRRDEYRTLRVLGYGDGLVTVLILVEVALIGVVALCAAVPIGAFAADYYNQRLSQAWFRIDTLVDGADYARVFAPASVCCWRPRSRRRWSRRTAGRGLGRTRSSDGPQPGTPVVAPVARPGSHVAAGRRSAARRRRGRDHGHRQADADARFRS